MKGTGKYTNVFYKNSFWTIDAIHGAFKQFTNVYSGRSEQGQPLKAYRWGEGPLRVLLWTQMHGNEPTGTAALLACLPHLLEQRSWFTQMCVLMIPVLNPDGAVGNQRVNALGIDLNRDAQVQGTAGSRFLQRVVQDFAPQFALNIHDQRRSFSVGHPPQPAVLSFGAAAPLGESAALPSRQVAQQLILALAHFMKRRYHLPPSLYSDAPYPRAWGDRLQAAGIATVLLEAGAYYDDPWRLRAQAVLAGVILEALRLIATQEYEGYTAEEYRQLPSNARHLRDCLLRGVQVEIKGMPALQTDVSVQYQEWFEPPRADRIWCWDEIGDLAHLGGLRQHAGGRLVLSRQPLPGTPATFEYRSAQDERIIVRDGKDINHVL